MYMLAALIPSWKSQEVQVPWTDVRMGNAPSGTECDPSGLEGPFVQRFGQRLQLQRATHKGPLDVLSNSRKLSKVFAEMGSLLIARLVEIPFSARCILLLPEKRRLKNELCSCRCPKKMKKRKEPLQFHAKALSFMSYSTSKSTTVRTMERRRSSLKAQKAPALWSLACPTDADIV